MKKICIVQTGTGSSKELMDLCGKIMPEVKVYQIIDDSMLVEMLEKGGATPDVNRRLFHYYEQAQSLGVDAIFHQCVIAGETALLLEKFMDIPVVRIDEGMLLKALETGDRIAILATSPVALIQSRNFLNKLADKQNRKINISTSVVTKETIKEIAEETAKENDVIVLAQPSMTAVAPLLAEINIPVLTAPESGIEYLKKVLYGQ
ncbi:MAG: hypothetical protein IKR11_00765 [Solobacterium sp.]|nr:hypothetical protein [Solobacterium sp.]